MRVAIVTATPDGIALGSGTFVAARNLRTGLEQLGHEVLLVPPAAPPASSVSSAPSAAALLWHRFRFNTRLRARDVSGCDLVCGFDLDGWTLARSGPAPFVSYLHGVIADEARFERGLTRWSLGIQARAERVAARRASRVLAPSRYSAGRINRLYGIDPGRIRVAPPGFDIDRWRHALAAVPPAQGPGQRILCVGRLYPRKNHAGLLRAMALLRPAFPDVTLRIVGDGPERKRLERLTDRLGLRTTVHFTGQVPYAQLVAEYAACDVFCLPTLQEGFGLVFAEAMTAGKAIVACDAGATPEVVTPGENGLLAPAGDDRALADDLAVVLGDAGIRGRLGDTNRIQAPRRFGIREAAERFIEAVRDLPACEAGRAIR